MTDPTGNWPKWLTGTLNVISGALQVAAGATIGAVAGWTGVGAVAAGVLIVNGASTIAQGVGQIYNSVTQSNGMREDNIVRTEVQSIGGFVGEVLGGTEGREKGESLTGTLYDTAVVVSSYYPAAVSALESVKSTTARVLNAKMPEIVKSKLFNINGGYGIKIGNSIEMFYQNPNASGGMGGTILSYNGKFGKFRIDWDPTHLFHTHPPGHL